MDTAERLSAFVGGATGYTGLGVLAALRRRDIHTVAHIRPDSQRLQACRAQFEAEGICVDSTPWEGEAIARTLVAHRPTMVFSLLGTTRARVKAEVRSGQARQSYDVVDLGMTLQLLEASARLEPLPRFVYLSAMGVRKARPGSYFHARYQAEAALKVSELPWVIARPAFISGPDRRERRRGERFAARLTDGLLKGASRLGWNGAWSRYGSMSGEVLGEALVAAALREDTVGEVLEAEQLRALV